MTIFLLLAILLVIITLIVLVPPLLRGNNLTDEETVAALAVLRGQKAELEAEHGAGQIDEATYVRSLEELEQRTISDIDANGMASTIRAKPVPGWAVFLSAALPMLVVGLYLILGNPTAVDASKVNPQTARQITPAQIDALVARLAEHVKTHPEDLEGAQKLGQSYMLLERFADAADVFAQLAKQKPNDAQIYADWANALASAQGKMAGKPEELVAQALKLSPDNEKALALAGSAAFEREDYKQAISDWQNVLTRIGSDGNSEMVQAIQGNIAEARARENGTATNAKVADASPQTGLLKLHGRVTLTEQLRNKASPSDVLFVFVRPVAGGPPLAAMRFHVSDLPLNFDFSNSPLMLGQTTLPEKVMVVARISKSGGAIADSGDMEGSSSPVTPNATAVNIVIEREIHS
ncbi:MAG TPA: c-type cytochrome biogenesis protein CcmI, partial [Rhodocyclaceae bacterium]|nr:c-type cytochrome biogenesis protein CcmI [Rhodocyclaceae bacterium]